MSVYKWIMEEADKLSSALVAQRRDFHKYAEAGWFEMRTSSIIARQLTDLGYEVLVGEQVCKKDARMGVPPDEKLEKAYQRALDQGADPEFVEYTKGGMTGVIGILRCGEGPALAMRFDIDALGVIESQEPDHRPAAEGFASVNQGEMHACGHDGHATIGLGVAKLLMAMRDQLHGTVKLIFQPAEEGVRGAKSIVENGHLDGVDILLGNHVSGTDDGCVDVIPGAYGSLATAKYDVTYRGLAAHAGGSPHLGKNAMLAAATAVLNLNAIPRHGAGSSRINVGRLVAGSGRNVTPDEAFLELEVRGQTTEINGYMEAYAQRILKAAADMHDCTVDIKLMGAATSISSDKELALRMAKLCAEELSMAVPENVMIKSGGSEDFAYMSNRVQEQGGQAVFMRVYTKTYAGAHNRKFDFEESYLAKGVKVFCAAAYDILK